MAIAEALWPRRLEAVPRCGPAGERSRWIASARDGEGRQRRRQRGRRPEPGAGSSRRAICCTTPSRRRSGGPAKEAGSLLPGSSRSCGASRQRYRRRPPFTHLANKRAGLTQASVLLGRHSRARRRHGNAVSGFALMQRANQGAVAAGLSLQWGSIRHAQARPRTRWRRRAKRTACTAALNAMSDAMVIRKAREEAYLLLPPA